MAFETNQLNVNAGKVGCGLEPRVPAEPLSHFKPFRFHWNIQFDFRCRRKSIASATSLRRRCEVGKLTQQKKPPIEAAFVVKANFTHGQ